MTTVARRILSAAARTERGSTLPVVAVGLMVTLTAAALAADLGKAYALRAQLQTTADAAALAAAARLPDLEAATAAAIAYAQKNMPVDEYGEVLLADDIEFGAWEPRTASLTPSERATAVRVTPRLAADHNNAVEMFFAGKIGVDLLDLEARATAGRRSPSCIVALDPSEPQSMYLSKGTVEALECSIQVTSTQADALTVADAGQISANTICVAGGASIASSASASPTPIENCPPSPDPLIALTPPLVGGCDYTKVNHRNTAATLSPGVYCGGLKIGSRSDVSLLPGLYVIKDGPLAVGSSATLSGSGVTFYLTGADARLQFNSDASVSLTAPEDGDLAGILFFQDRAFGGLHVWNSDQPTELVGTIYLPGGDLQSKSSNAITSNASCNVLIARTLTFGSGSGVSIDLASSGCRKHLPKVLRGAVVLLD